MSITYTIPQKSPAMYTIHTHTYEEAQPCEYHPSYRQVNCDPENAREQMELALADSEHHF